MATKQKSLTAKQKLALELLTCGKGLKYKEICEQVNITPKTLYEWRTSNDFVLFQEEWARLNEQRWLATVDAAREGALKLCENGNQKMIEFVLKNEGYNPAQKVEAEVNSSIDITID